MGVCGRRTALSSGPRRRGRCRGALGCPLRRRTRSRLPRPQGSGRRGRGRGRRLRVLVWHTTDCPRCADTNAPQPSRRLPHLLRCQWRRRRRRSRRRRSRHRICRRQRTDDMLHHVALRGRHTTLLRLRRRRRQSPSQHRTQIFSNTSALWRRRLHPGHDGLGRTSNIHRRLLQGPPTLA